MSQITLTHEQWLAELDRRRKGAPAKTVSFVCPACGYIQSGEDFLAAGASYEQMQAMLAFSCLGRVMPRPRSAFAPEGAGPCNYAGGGLFRIAPIRVTFADGRDDLYVFDFADDPLCTAPTATSASGGVEA